MYAAGGGATTRFLFVAVPVLVAELTLGLGCGLVLGGFSSVGLKAEVCDAARLLSEFIVLLLVKPGPSLTFVVEPAFGFNNVLAAD